jgi:integrase
VPKPATWFDFHNKLQELQMASVVKRKRKDGTPSWYARYRDGQGKDVWENCRSAREARSRAAEIELLLARSAGAWMPPAKVTVAEYAERWLAERGPSLRPHTLWSHRRIFDKELLPYFGRMPLAAVSRSDIKTFAAKRAAGDVSFNTVRNVLAPLRAMLSTAVEDDLVRENVALRLPRVGRPPRSIEAPTTEQVEAVIAAASPAGRGPIMLAATSGLRRGEVFGLRWKDVDFEARLIHVRVANLDGVISKPKTKAGERIVPMFGSLRGLLLEERAASPFKAPDDFVFASQTGELRSPNGWLKWEFYPALKRAGVKPFRFHDLRHFAVSQLVAQGANILQISRIAGHADPSITLRVYSHLMADGLAQAAELYDPLRASVVDGR